jgi:hypothetical protein
VACFLCACQWCRALSRATTANVPVDNGYQSLSANRLLFFLPTQALAYLSCMLLVHQLSIMLGVLKIKLALFSRAGQLWKQSCNGIHHVTETISNFMYATNHELTSSVDHLKTELSALVNFSFKESIQMICTISSVHR